MHPDVEEAIDQIDAAVFSGDTFRDSDDRQTLLLTMDRWTRELARIVVAIAEEAAEAQPEYVDEYEDADWINIEDQLPNPNQAITARVKYGTERTIIEVKGARSSHEPMVVLFDFYSGTAGEVIIQWKPRTLPNRTDAHPWQGIENRGID